jgi:hypothetical protein
MYASPCIELAVGDSCGHLYIPASRGLFTAFALLPGDNRFAAHLNVPKWYEGHFIVGLERIFQTYPNLDQFSSFTGSLYN